MMSTSFAKCPHCGKSIALNVEIDNGVPRAQEAGNGREARPYEVGLEPRDPCEPFPPEVLKLAKIARVSRRRALEYWEAQHHNMDELEAWRVWAKGKEPAQVYGAIQNFKSPRDMEDNEMPGGPVAQMIERVRSHLGESIEWYGMPARVNPIGLVLDQRDVLLFSEMSADEMSMIAEKIGVEVER